MAKRALSAAIATTSGGGSSALTATSTGPAFWLIKSEPADYSIAALRVEGRTVWDGVRNPTARKHLRAMQVGDQCLFYHSSCKQIGVVGLATVCRAHYADPADKAWAVVDVEYRDTYRQIISLDALKQHRDGALAGMALFKMSRLSVQPVSRPHFDFIATTLVPSEGPVTNPFHADFEDDGGLQKKARR